MKRSAIFALIVTVFPIFAGAAAHADTPAHGNPAPAAQGTQAAQATPASAASPASPEQTQEVVNRVQAFYDKSTTFKSEFRQKFWVKAYNQEKSSRGRVTFSKPGKMDWQYDEPQGNRVVSDGSLLKVYEAANKQMYEQGIDKSQYPAALSFLTGQGKLSDHFTFELFKGEQMNFPGGLVLVGVPKVTSPAYTKVLFYVDTQTAQVRRVMIIDGQSNRNRFDFVSPRINEQVAPAQFQFTPPQGTTIIHP